MINVGFIGAGNMGYAIMKGIAGSKMGKDIQLYAFDKYAPILDRLDKLGTVKCSGCAEVVEKSEYVFLAIKPQQLDEVLDEIASAVTKDTAQGMIFCISMPLRKAEKSLVSYQYSTPL